MKGKKKRAALFVVGLVAVLVLSTVLVGSGAAGTPLCPPSLLDSVNIGDSASEGLHDLHGWSNTWYSCGWCGPDGNMRLIWGDGGETCDLVDNWASVTLDAGCKTALSLKVDHLAGAADDGFNVYVNGDLVGTYVDNISSNTWLVTEFDISSGNHSGLLTVKFVATAPAWDLCGTYGQVAFNLIELYGADTTPPEISVSVNPDTLWPPNHKMVDITAMVTVSDNCDTAPSVVLDSVLSSEPDNAKGNGDGNTIDDIQNADIGHEDYSFSLRAERAFSGDGDGRVYTITYTATDACGNSASESATVTVAPNQGKK